jgi:hypothetical protein
MSLPRPGKFACCLLVALGLALPAAPGQPTEKSAPRKATAPVAVQRQTYAVRGAAAKNLANALTLHFQAEPGFQAIPEAGSNVLLLSGPKAALEEALAVLREIDRPARSVRVDVYLVDVTPKTGGEAGGNAKSLDATELLGNAGEVRAKLRDLQQKGVVTSVKMIELSSLAGQSARTQVSENRPYVTGVTVTGGGRGGAGGLRGNRGGGEPGDNAPAGGGFGGMASRSIAYRNVGTSVQVTPELGADGQVLLDLHVDDSTMRPPTGADDKSGSPGAEFLLFTLESRLKLRPGQVVLAEGTKADSKTSKAETIVLVSATAE